VQRDTWLADHCSEMVTLDDRAAALSDDLRTRLKTSLEGLARSLAVANARLEEAPP